MDPGAPLCPPMWAPLAGGAEPPVSDWPVSPHHGPQSPLAAPVAPLRWRHAPAVGLPSPVNACSGLAAALVLPVNAHSAPSVPRLPAPGLSVLSVPWPEQRAAAAGHRASAAGAAPH